MQTLPPGPMLAKMVARVVLSNRLLAALLIALVAGLAGAAPAQTQSQTQAKARPVRIVVLGDSLVAGFQIKTSEAFPAQLERALKARGHAVVVINAGVSGDTTAGALERLAWAVPDRTDAVIVELGANDALRGLDPARAKLNLDTIVAKLKTGGAEVLLAGMLAPRNFGEDYARRFDAIYGELAGKHGVLLYPFFLDGVALDAKLNLADGLHPNADGVAEITRRILPLVEQLIARVQARQAASKRGR
jgi:acyl-CoA thioesterase I